MSEATAIEAGLAQGAVLLDPEMPVLEPEEPGPDPVILMAGDPPAAQKGHRVDKKVDTEALRDELKTAGISVSAINVREPQTQEDGTVVPGLVVLLDTIGREIPAPAATVASVLTKHVPKVSRSPREIVESAKVKASGGDTTGALQDVLAFLDGLTMEPESTVEPTP